jgi:FkbM family methyltransferase
VEENTKLNSMTNIETFNMALGAKISESNLFLSKAGNESSSLYQWQSTCDKCIEVRVVTLDEWIQKCCIKNIDLLKVDTEGSELDIFLGGERSLRGGIIKAIIVEFNKETQKAAGFSSDDLRLLLERYGFEWYRVPYDVRNYTEVDWPSLANCSDLIAIRRNP